MTVEPGPDGGVSATPLPGGSATATVIAPPAKVTKIIEHGEASALPKASRWWRLIIVVFVILFAESVTAWVVYHSTDIRSIKTITLWQIGLVYFAMFLYVADGSAQDVVRLVAAFKSTRRETVVSHGPGDEDGEAYDETPARRDDDRPPWEKKR